MMRSVDGQSLTESRLPLNRAIDRREGASTRVSWAATWWENWNGMEQGAATN